MAANNALNVVNLDFNGIKNSLINSLKANQLFKDYNFEGSQLNVLIELLARNSSLGGFLTNMLFSEAFMDSAQLTTSVFSIAKELNYTPRSPRSAKGTIRCTFQASGENQPYIIQKGSSFNTLIKNKSFVFSMPETIIVSSPNTSFSFTTDIYEGIYLQDSYVYVTTPDEPYPRFKITNKSVDTSSLTVSVFEDGAQVGVPYNFATSLLGLDDTSEVYFVQSGDDAYYEVQFGDGVIGRKPKENAVIVLDYRICNLDKANGATKFSINFDPTGTFAELATGQTNNPAVVTVQNADGGAVSEDIESVRYYAPRWYQTQERAVTASDYEILLKTAFPEINAVAVYGGEDESPPQFGTVIVSVDITGIDGLPPTKRDQYYKYLKQRCPLSINPVFKDPIFTFLEVDTTVRYNVNISPSSIDRIQTLVLNTVNQFNDTYLNDFTVTFRYSQFVHAIDTSDSSIISNLTTIRLYKKTVPTLQQPSGFVLNYGVTLAVEPDSTTFPDSNRTVSSSTFTYKGDLVTLQDDGNGNLFIVKSNSLNTFSKIQNIGKVDYNLGIVTITGLNIDGFDGDFLEIFVIPADRDVIAAQRNILLIEPSHVNIDVKALRV